MRIAPKNLIFAGFKFQGGFEKVLATLKLFEISLPSNCVKCAVLFFVEVKALFEFYPFSFNQKRLLTWWMPCSPYAHNKMIIVDGSIRSGKTIACIDGFITWSITCFPNGGDFIVAGKSMGALKRNVIGPLQKILASKAIKYNYIRSGSEPRIVIGKNNYYLFGANNEASQDVIQGMTAHGAYGDEVALFPESFVTQMIGRCSIKGSKIWLNCNPAGPYHYVKLEYLDKVEEKKILHLHFDLDDNKSLSDETKEMYKRMFTGVFYKRNIEGLWVLAIGIIYPHFDESRHCLTADEVPTDLTRLIVGGDHGIVNPCAALKVGIKRIDGKIHAFVFDEFYSASKEGNKTDNSLAEEYKIFIGEDKVTHIWDPEATGFLNLLKQNFDRTTVKLAKKDVKAGISTVSTFLAEDRIHIVKHNCPNLIKEFASYVWDEKKARLGFDEPIKASDHCLDALRYLLFTEYPAVYKAHMGSAALF